MGVLRHSKTLLSVPTATNSGQVGTTYVVVPADGDRVRDHEQSWVAWFTVSQVGGAGAPSTDARVETSFDGSEWVPAAEATALVAAGDVAEMQPVRSFGPYIRAVTELAGATKPNHTASIILASDGPFRLKAVS